MSTTIVWFRQDLRLLDNPSLRAAEALGLPVIPIYLWAPKEEGSWPMGGASRWWLHHSLSALSESLKGIGLSLIIRAGNSVQELTAIIKASKAKHLVFSRRYEPEGMLQERAVESQMTTLGIDCQSFNSSLLFDPREVMSGKGTPFKVFTPFWKACLKSRLIELPTIAKPLLKPALRSPSSLKIEQLDLLPRIHWADGIGKAWVPGETGAQTSLQVFAKSVLDEYSETRNLPSLEGTSRLSPHLHFGEISPRQIWEVTAENPMTLSAQSRTGMATYPKEIGWREFAYHLMFHFPFTTNKPLRTEFSKFPWKTRKSALLAWERGSTGFPIVDAGMRQLWEMGWMHNRVRMIVASFLVKHLLISWQQGAKWFWDTLVDADLASNTLGWQWVAGCGADAAPYFRIFNPVLQGEKFDPDGRYVRRWIPELTKMPKRWVHRPWEASPADQKSCGLSRKSPYVSPIVDLREGRDAALQAYQSMKERR